MKIGMAVGSVPGRVRRVLSRIPRGPHLQRPHALVGSLSILLALAMPVEQMRCMSMLLERHAAPTSSPAGHECCPPVTPAPSPTDECCASGACLQSHSASVPAQAGSLDAPTDAPVAVVECTTGVEPARLRAADPTLHSGSPPLQFDPGAHRLRAPPPSA